MTLIFRRVLGAVMVLLWAAGPVLAHPSRDERLAILDAEIAADPGDPSPYVDRAALHLLLGHPKPALADCATAEGLVATLSASGARVSLPEIHLIRAEVALAERNYPRALAHLERFLAEQPDDARGLVLRGRVLRLLGRPAEAAEAFARAVDTAPAPGPELHLERARALEAAGRPAEALDTLRRALGAMGPVPALVARAEELGGRLDLPAGPLEPPARTGPSGHQERSTPEPAAGALFIPPFKIVRGPYLQRVTPTGAVVRWRTAGPIVGRVRFGPAPDQLDHTSEEDTLGTDHEVFLDGLDGLSPGTRVHYAIVPTGEEEAPLPNGSFVTPPPTGTPRPTRIWVIGDSGTADDAARSVRDAYRAFAADRPADLWLMLGDNAYLNGTEDEYQAAVFDTYTEELRSLPLWPTLGNHDGRSADSETGSGVYYDLFTLPTRGEAGGVPSGTEAYYSFDHGDIHFVCLNSHDVDRSTDGAMLTWLRADLEAAAASGARWVIAFWHHPPYSKGSHDSDTEAQLIEMRERALPILEAGGVDLVLGGHSHAYERSLLLDRHYGRSDTLTPAMVLDGGDGRPEGTGAYAKPTGAPSPHEGAVYVVAGSSGRIGPGPLDHPAMTVSLRELGSLVLDIDGNRLDATFLDADGLAADRFTLLKGPEDPPPPPADLLTDADFPGFRFGVRITDQAGGSREGAAEAACLPETLCVSGAVPGRTEVLVRIVGPKPNGYLWPTLAKLTTSRVEVWIEQVATGVLRYYLLEGASPGVDELPGLFDRTGFLPADAPPTTTP